MQELACLPYCSACQLWGGSHPTRRGLMASECSIKMGTAAARVMTGQCSARMLRLAHVFASKGERASVPDRL